MACSDAQDRFRVLSEDSANQSCLDSGVAEPGWASVSHGIFLDIGAAGVHRSLGVRVSRVQSVEMDSWKPLQLRMMQLGGNQRFRDFLGEHGVPKDMPIRDKYNTRAADWYRQNLLAEAQGFAPPAPLAPEEGCLPMPGSERTCVLDTVFVDVPQGDLTKASGRDVANVQVPERARSKDNWACKCLCDGIKAALGAAGARRRSETMDDDDLSGEHLGLKLGDWIETLADRIHMTAACEVQIDGCATPVGKLAASC